MDSEQSPALELTVERARAILADAPRAKIGILTRRRKWIPELIRKLRDASIPASDEGGNPLTDSVAVLHALSLLHLADHPGDLAAAFHVATSPLGARVGLSGEEFRKIENARERASTIARDVRNALAEQGYGGWLASIRPRERDGYGRAGDEGENIHGMPKICPCRYGGRQDATMFWPVGRERVQGFEHVKHRRLAAASDQPLRTKSCRKEQIEHHQAAETVRNDDQRLLRIDVFG